MQPEIPDDIRKVLLFNRQQLIRLISALSTSQGMRLLISSILL